MYWSLFENDFQVEVVVQNMDNAVHRKELNSDIHISNLGVNSAKKVLPKLIKYFKTNHVEIAIAFSPELAVNLYLVKKILRLKTIIIGRNTYW